MMAWEFVIGPIANIIDKLIPDADAKAKAHAELMMLQAKGELDAQLGQIQINIEQAKHPSLLVSGGRPFVMWVCGIALAYATIVEPLFRFIATVVFGYTGAFPVIDTTLTLQILLALLGLGGYRSFEKVKGVASK